MAADLTAHLCARRPLQLATCSVLLLVRARADALRHEAGLDLVQAESKLLFALKRHVRPEVTQSSVTACKLKSDQAQPLCDAIHFRSCSCACKAPAAALACKGLLFEPEHPCHQANAGLG